MKKVGMIFGGLFGLFLLTALIVPLVVDVDQYRPEIVKTANENINGSVELGKLSLSLWGRVLVQVDGVKVHDKNKNELVSVDEAYFHLPFFSLLTGSPTATLRMKQPKIKVIQNKKGKINLLSLVKEPKKNPSNQQSNGQGNLQGQGSKTKAQQDSQASNQSQSDEIEIPGIVARARLGIELIDSELDFTDQKTGLTNKTSGLNFIAKDISLSDTSEIELWADLDTKLAKTFSVKGPFRIQASFTPRLENNRVSGVSGSLKVSLDELDISVPGSFQKSSKIPANLKVQFDTMENSAKISQGHVEFHNAKLDLRGEVKDFETSNVNLNLNSNTITLESWEALLPSLKDLGLTGTMSLKAFASGPSKALEYGADLSVKKLEIEHPKFRSKPVVNIDVTVATNQIKKFLMTLDAKKTDLKINGSLKNFNAPQLVVSANSKSMNLNEWVNLPPKNKKPKTTAAKKSSQSGGSASKSGGSSSKGSKASSQSSLDQSLDPLRKNKMARKASAKINTNFSSIKFYDVEVKNFKTQFLFKNLVASLKQFKFGVFDGTIATSGKVDLKPKQPTYSISADVAGLDLKKAVESQLELFKNTFYGKMNFRFAGNGASIDPEVAKVKLNAKGSLRVNEATFASIDVTKMTQEALNRAIDRIGKKYPQIKDKKIKKLPNTKTKYETITSDFSMKNGRFDSPNFYAKAKAQKGVDLKGRTTADLKDESLNARWEVIDSHNITKAKDISVKIAGTQVNSILAGRDGKVRFPVTVSCKTSAPCYKYGEVPEYLAKVALDNVSRAGQQRAKSEAKKKVQQVIQKQAPQIKKIFKGFGF